MDTCGQLETSNIWYARFKGQCCPATQLLAFNPYFQVFGGLKAPGATHGNFQPSRPPERGGLPLLHPDSEWCTSRREIYVCNRWFDRVRENHQFELLSRDPKDRPLCSLCLSLPVACSRGHAIHFWKDAKRNHEVSKPQEDSQHWVQHFKLWYWYNLIQPGHRIDMRFCFSEPIDPRRERWMSPSRGKKSTSRGQVGPVVRRDRREGGQWKILSTFQYL